MDQDGPTKPQHVMTIEMKRLGFLIKKEFRPALYKHRIGCVPPTDEIWSIKMRLTDTLLSATDKAWIFSKQAAAYAVQYNCNDLALCDYETLILLHFQDECEFAYIKFVPRDGFRLALLGFMLAAYDAAKLPA